jgi:hypothetical protein
MDNGSAYPDKESGLMPPAKNVHIHSLQYMDTDRRIKRK